MSEATTSPSQVEEHYYRRGDIDFCFLLNRQHHNLRVFDYRVGNYQQKRDFFDRIARSEGLRKVFTVVEKQDSKSWRSVGFSREGAIPGYFRTADAYIMSRVYTESGDPIQGGAPKLNAPSPSSTEGGDGKTPNVNTELITSPDALKSLTEKLGESALYAPFRRQVFSPDLALHAKASRQDYWVGAELDTSFGHAKIDLMTPPTDEAQVPLLEQCVERLLEELLKREMASVFALCPADWDLSSRVYSNRGFKVTARLTDHVTRDDGYVGVQLWHRRIAGVSTPRLPSFI